MEKTDQQFNQIFEDYLKDFEDTPVSKEIQSLLPIVIFALQGLTDQLPQYVEKALQNGVSQEKILEVIYQLEPIGGIGRARAALKAAHQVLPTKELIQKQDNPQFGKDMQKKIYGTEIRNLLSDLPEHAGDFVADHLTDHFFGDFYQHESLSVEERELFELVSFITLNVEFQINAHAKGAIKAGNSEATLVWTIINMLPYVGFPLVINSIQKVHKAAMELKKQN